MSKIHKTIATQLRALAKSFDAYVCDVQTFDESPIARELEAALKGASDILRPALETARDNAREAFEKEHGDAEKQMKLALRKMLNDGALQILTDNGLSAVRASGERKQPVRLTDAQKQEICNLRRAYIAEKEKSEGERDSAVISRGQIGNIADAFNVSAPTVSLILDEAGLTNKRTTTATE